MAFRKFLYWVVCSFRYKETFNRLRDLKHEIEHMQHLLEMAKVKLMKDFEVWWSEQSAAAAEVRNVSLDLMDWNTVSNSLTSQGVV